MSKKNPLSEVKVSKIIWPVIIGLLVVGYMIWRDINVDIFKNIRFTWHSVLFLLFAVLCIVGRDFGYMLRIRLLSSNQLTWRQAFRVIMLWEFTSAITPTTVGGTSVAILYVHKEGIGLGRSSTIILLTSLLDELYFIIMFPLLLLLVGPAALFEISASGIVVKSLMSFALIGYLLKFAYVLILSYGLFINPDGLKWLLLKIFKIRFLRKWYSEAVKVGNDIVASSLEIRKYSAGFWAKAGAFTFLSWSSRYMVANMLITALFNVTDQLLLFARQLVMWIMMLIMPTPGGAGIAEYIFTTYCRDLIDVPAAMQLGAVSVIALLWRLITYYPYLAIGAVIFPRWLRLKFGEKQKNNDHEQA